MVVRTFGKMDVLKEMPSKTDTEYVVVRSVKEIEIELLDYLEEMIYPSVPDADAAGNVLCSNFMNSHMGSDMYNEYVVNYSGDTEQENYCEEQKDGSNPSESPGCEMKTKMLKAERMNLGASCLRMVTKMAASFRVFSNSMIMFDTICARVFFDLATCSYKYLGVCILISYKMFEEDTVLGILADVSHWSGSCEEEIVLLEEKFLHVLGWQVIMDVPDKYILGLVVQYNKFCPYNYMVMELLNLVYFKVGYVVAVNVIVNSCSKTSKLVAKQCMLEVLQQQLSCCLTAREK